jgi:hypothetical protein
MPFVSGFLRIRRGAGHPDQGLPGVEEPADPGYGIEEGGMPDQGLPTPPPGVWPPLTPSHPIQPAPPGTPPGSIWPPVGHPGHPIAPVRPGRPPRPDQGLPPTSPGHPEGLPPTAPGHPDQGLPTPPKVYWVVAGIPGVGWRYICVDPSLHPDQGLPAYPDQGLPPTAPGHPDQGLPPSAQPKR